MSAAPSIEFPGTRELGRPGRPLGKKTKSPSALVLERLSDTEFAGKLRAEQHQVRYRERRRQRHRLRAFLWDYSQLDRVRHCGRRRISTAAAVDVRRQEGVSHYAGLQLCGSIHACPVCSARIRQRRAEDADHAARWWLERHGQGSVMLLTLTLPHYASESLAALLGLVRRAFGDLISGRRWQADKAQFALAYYIRAHDVTVGPNGWHPHLHVILFADRALSRAELAALTDRLYERWRGAVVRRGHRPPSREHGIQLEQAHTRADVARYVCQVVVGPEVEEPTGQRAIALELARADLKLSRHAGHRTIWQLLDDAEQTGDCASLDLFHEWERESRGMRAICWSRGLRLQVGLGREQTDEEVVAEEIGGELVYRFSLDGDEWRAVCATRGAPAEILELSESGGTPAVARRVAELLVRWRERERQRRRREAA